MSTTAFPPWSASTSSGNSVPSRMTNAHTVNSTLFARNAPSREIGESITQRSQGYGNVLDRITSANVVLDLVERRAPAGQLLLVDLQQRHQADPGILHGRRAADQRDDLFDGVQGFEDAFFQVVRQLIEKATVYSLKKTCRLDDDRPVSLNNRNT